MGIRKGRGAAIAAVTLGIALSAGAGCWFWDDLLEWIAFLRADAVLVYNEYFPYDHYAMVSIRDPKTFPRIRALRKRFLQSLLRWEPTPGQIEDKDRLDLIRDASLNLLKASDEYWPGDRFSMDYYRDSGGKTGSIRSLGAPALFCDEDAWNRFLRSIIEVALLELKATLEDESAAKKDRMDVAHTLSWVVPSDPVVLAFLQNALGDEDYKGKAVYALGSMGHWAKPAVPRLLELLVKEDLDDVILALGKIGDDSPPVISALIAKLDEVWRRHAVIALGSIGPGAVAAVPHLESLLTEEDDELQEAVNEALKKIRGR